MTEATRNAGQWLARWTSIPYAYLTTTGRRTGQPHRIEIWFGVDDGRMYLLSGGRDRSDWVRNLRENAQVMIELGDETRNGMARILQEGTAEDRHARDLLVAKYATPANTLEDWGRRSLAVVVEFPADASSPSHEHDTD
jgi:deazaflavin-dependent oxidoreductase (nitroreductase family)